MSSVEVTGPEPGKEGSSAGKGRELWNWHPPFPMPRSPIAQWPIRPLILLKNLLGGWFPISVKLFIAFVAALTWAYLTPSPDDTRTFSSDWIAYVFFRNLVMLTVVAGGLHLYLYTFHRQADHLRYETRPLQTDSRRFTFNNQTYDNIFWSLASGVPIWTAYEVVGLWAYANGYLPIIGWSDHPVWFLALFVIIPLFGNFHFYWIHRLIHWQPLYARVHHLHHRNIVTGPWSGFSMHPVEHLLYLSSVAIHVILASHPIHFIFHLQSKVLQGPTSHAGFEKITAGTESENGLAIGDFFHQLHHRYFECNYGEPDIPFDEWFGTYHDGTPEGLKHIRSNMKKRGVTRG